MKNMKNTFQMLIRVTFLIVTILTSHFSVAQERKGLPVDTDFHFYIANIARMNDARIEFDLLLLNTNPASTLELGTVQAGILIDPAVYSKGSVSAMIIPGSSTLNPSQVPGVITFVQKKNCIKLAPKSPPGIGSGSIISTDPQNPSRLCRISLTNSKGWMNSDPGIRFCLTSKPYPTKISRYVHATGLNTPMTVNSYTCFTMNEEKNSKSLMKKADMAGSEKIKIYPSPNDGTFSVEVTYDTPEVFQMQIHNDLGTLVYQNDRFEVKGITTELISLKNLPEGTYTLSLSKKGDFMSRKFIVKH
jgi:hypothetical protein